MIKITILYDQELIKQITIEGHSNFKASGQDIVCAGVSAVAEGSVNAIEEITKKKPNYIMKDGYLSITYSNEHDLQLIAKVTYAQLQTIAISYPKNVKIIEK
ncbi:MAG: ribosomal-processing cysteine protease Prp [Bacilli bacterium]|jgi:uncharacterized protein|nr:ribosomal-processing cysteine protease Prp [Bacilli bacterium]